MGLTGVALIVIAIGALSDDREGIATFAAVVYVSLGIYFSVNRNKMVIQFYLENGWVQADSDSNAKSRAAVPHPPLHLKEARTYVEPEKARAAVPRPPLHDRVPTPFPQAATKGAFCRDCGAPAGDSKFCPRCGQPQRPSNICSRCGTQLRVGSTFCAECGAKSA